MKLALISLSIIACLCLNCVSATETQLPTNNDIWFDVESVALEPESVPLESEAEHQARCAKELKKAKRKEFWATFLLGIVSGIGNASLSRREADVTFTDKNGNKSRGTVEYTDQYRLDYLNEKDRQSNRRATANIAATQLQNSGCR